eukprot:507871_1
MADYGSHQLIAPKHHCDCLEGFESRIDVIKIGNPDDGLNRLKDMKRRMELKDEKIQQLEKEKEELRMEMKQHLSRNMCSPKPIGSSSPPVQMPFTQYIERMVPVIPSLPCNPSIYALNGGALSPLQQVLSLNNIPPPPSMFHYPTVPCPLPYNTNGLPMVWQRTT